MFQNPWMAASEGGHGERGNGTVSQLRARCLNFAEVFRGPDLEMRVPNRQLPEERPRSVSDAASQVTQDAVTRFARRKALRAPVG